MQLCVRKANRFDDEMDEFGHTPKGRRAFATLRRQRCSKLLAVTCALFLAARQNRAVLINSCYESIPS